MISNMISTEITAGNLITAVSILGGWIFFVAKLKGEVNLLAQALNAIDRRLSSVENTIQTIGLATIQLAKQEVRLESVESRIKDIEKIEKRQR